MYNGLSHLNVSSCLIETNDLDLFCQHPGSDYYCPWGIEDTFNRHNIPEFIREYFVYEYFPNKVPSRFFYEIQLIQ